MQTTSVRLPTAGNEQFINLNFIDDPDTAITVSRQTKYDNETDSNTKFTKCEDIIVEGRQLKH